MVKTSVISLLRIGTELFGSAYVPSGAKDLSENIASERSFHINNYFLSFISFATSAQRSI